MSFICTRNVEGEKGGPAMRWFPGVRRPRRREPTESINSHPTNLGDLGQQALVRLRIERHGVAQLLAVLGLGPLLQHTYKKKTQVIGLRRVKQLKSAIESACAANFREACSTKGTSVSPSAWRGRRTWRPWPSPPLT